MKRKTILILFFINWLCGVTNAQTCTWLGTTNNWNTNSNWSPTKPTLTDTAVIPVVSGSNVYPLIQGNINIKCASLRIANKAHVTVLADTGTIITIADKLVIGDSSYINAVSSIAYDTITIPQKTAVPPAGIAIATVSPLRTNAQAKTQIAYTATELANIYGLHAGDIIRKLGIEVAAITGGAGPVTYPNFRIMAYLTNTPVTFPQTLPDTTAIAVAPTTPMWASAIKPGWPKQIYYNSSLSLNMPNSNGGTKANGNYYIFNLMPDSFIWDGVSNLVLSFEHNTTAGLSPAKIYVLYDENNGTSYTTLCLNYATVNQFITGYNIDGKGHSTFGNNSGISASTSNYRPRLDFICSSQPFKPFQIKIGGDWINNNSLFNYPASGFEPGKSKVIFYGSKNQNISGATTYFYNLEINKSTKGKQVFMQTNVSIGSGLILSKGKLLINLNVLTVYRPDTFAITRTIYGSLISEDKTYPYSYLYWFTGNNQSEFTVPFCTKSGTYIPLIYKGGIYTNLYQSFIKVATYPTSSANLPLPSTVINMNDSNGINKSSFVVNRFWLGKLSGKVSFSYLNSECPLPIQQSAIGLSTYSTYKNYWIRDTIPGITFIGSLVSTFTIGTGSGSIFCLSDSINSFRNGTSINSKISLYPNPLSASSTLSFENTQNERVRLIVFDVLGNVTEEQVSNTDNFIVERANKKPGVYFYKLEFTDRQLNGKFIVQ